MALRCRLLRLGERGRNKVKEKTKAEDVLDFSLPLNIRPSTAVKVPVYFKKN